MPEIALVSWNEKGFWQGNYWQDAEPSELELTDQSPDTFFTCSREETLDDAIIRARHEWPNAVVYPIYPDDETDSDDE